METANSTITRQSGRDVYDCPVTDAQLACKPLDVIHYEDDFGQLTTQVVRSVPYKLYGGMYVIRLHGKRGLVALCRCHPIPAPMELEDAG